MDHPELLRTMYLFRQLRHLMRFNGTTVIRAQSVADHIMNVCLLSMMIVDYQRTGDGGEFAKEVEGVSMERIFRMALLHEADEAICGDINYLVKNDYSQGELGSVYLNMARVIIKDKVFYPLTEGMRQQYQEAWEQVNGPFVGEVSDPIRTKEVRIVKAADILDVFLYCTEETVLGNHSREIQQAIGKADTVCREKHYIDLLFVKRVLNAVY